MAARTMFDKIWERHVISEENGEVLLYVDRAFIHERENSAAELCTIDDDGTKNYGAVCLNPEGSVTGYSGTPHCLQCGTEKLP